MKLRKKKGFTIIELVIVIAVIGILTAVLVPTFINLTNKANEAADDSLVKNLNTALKMEEQLLGNKKNETLQDAVDDLEAEGYLLENLVAKSGKDLLWDQPKNEFVLNKENKYQGKDYWQIVKEVPAYANQKYSYYAGKNFNPTVPDLKYGFDAGDNDNIETLKYTGDGAPGQNVSIRTNGGLLTIDAVNDSVKHFGQADYIDIIAVKGSSYHEQGTSSLIKIAKGRVALDQESNVGEIHLAKTGDVFGDIIIATSENAELPELSRDPVGTSLSSDILVCAVETQGQTPQYYWMSGNGTIEDSKILVSSNKEGTDKAAVTEETATSTARNIANAKVGEVVTDNGDNVPAASEITPEQLVDKTAKGAAKTFSEIDSKDKLIAFRDAWNEGKLANNGSYKLTVNIDLSGENWLPIGTFKNPFNGTFDGNNKEIIGLTGNNSVLTEFFTTDSTKVYGAAYGFISVAGNGDLTVKNVTFKNVDINISQGNCVGSVLGYAPTTSDFNSKADKVGKGNTAASEVKISDIVVSGTIVGKDTVGGIAGKATNANKTEFVNCINNANVTTSESRSAGILGATNSKGTDYLANRNKLVFEGCENHGTVHAGTWGAAGICSSINQANVAEFSSSQKEQIESGALPYTVVNVPTFTYSSCTNDGVITSSTGNAYSLFFDAGATGTSYTPQGIIAKYNNCIGEIDDYKIDWKTVDHRNYKGTNDFGYALEGFAYTSENPHNIMIFDGDASIYSGRTNSSIYNDFCTSNTSKLLLLGDANLVSASTKNYLNLRSIEIDLNGHVLTCDDVILSLYGNGATNIVVKNGTIKRTSEGAPVKIRLYSNFQTQVSFNNVTFNVEGSSKVEIVNHNSNVTTASAVLNFNNCNITNEEVLDSTDVQTVTITVNIVNN